jgi:ADP-ribosylglycohydrolase
MLLELAIGDAYGAAFEYAHPGFVQAENHGRDYARHPRHNLCAGCYTDDTQMSLALAEVLVAGALWTPEVLAAKFVEVFKRDPRPGYAGRFYGFLQQVQDGAQFLAEIHADSEKSGGAMRATPLGVLPTVAQVLEYARIQAAITHNTPNGIAAAQAAALLPHYFLYRRGPQADLGRFVAAYVPGPWSHPWRGKVSAPGWMSVCAAITALQAATSLRDLLRRCCAFTGDVDTVAAIAMAAGACCPALVPDLPPALFDGLENGPYGRDYLQTLDGQLLALVQTDAASPQDTQQAEA